MELKLTLMKMIAQDRRQRLTPTQINKWADRLHPLPEWMTVRDVAEHLRVSTRQIWRYVKRLNLPAKKLGGKTLFSGREIEEWTRLNILEGS